MRVARRNNFHARDAGASSRAGTGSAESRSCLQGRGQRCPHGGSHEGRHVFGQVHRVQGQPCHIGDSCGRRVCSSVVVSGSWRAGWDTFVSVLTGRRGWHRAYCGAAASGERRDVVAGWRAWRAVGVRAGHGSPDSVQLRPQMHPRGAREMLLALPSHRGHATAMQSNRTAETGNGGVGHRGEGYRRCLIRRGDVPTSVMHGASHSATASKVWASAEGKSGGASRSKDASSQKRDPSPGRERQSCWARALKLHAPACSKGICGAWRAGGHLPGQGSTSAGASVAAGPARVAVGSLASLAPLLPRVAEAHLPGRRDRGCGAERGEKTSAASVSGWCVQRSRAGAG